ncbi:MAG: hypothetical protein OEP48_09145 [Betaproteobacteria bacterium]|nr:hypothetical protein [Betaproteobacteria bacterium]MDH3438059.1 hypothetical protein [Betaproteobacteria bacterium]
MSQEIEQQVLETLRDIREGQREIIRLLSAQQAITTEQIKKSRESIAESVGLQRLALQRQRTVTLVAVPGILACIAAIAYLVLRYS